jgi:hypothetical protein
VEAFEADHGNLAKQEGVQFLQRALLELEDAVRSVVGEEEHLLCVGIGVVIHLLWN